MKMVTPFDGWGKEKVEESCLLIQLNIQKCFQDF